MTTFRLVAIFSGQCPHSINFKNDELPSLRAGLNEINNVSLEYISIDSPTRGLDDSYPEDLKTYMKWFPLFVLVTEDSWQRCLKDSSERLECRIFNGPASHCGRPSGRVENTSANILDWIRREIKNAHIRITFEAPGETSPRENMAALYNYCRDFFRRELSCSS